MKTLFLFSKCVLIVRYFHSFYLQEQSDSNWEFRNEIETIWVLFLGGILNKQLPLSQSCYIKRLIKLNLSLYLPRYNNFWLLNLRQRWNFIKIVQLATHFFLNKSTRNQGRFPLANLSCLFTSKRDENLKRNTGASRLCEINICLYLVSYKKK